MPLGDFVNQIPAPIFLLIHLVAFAIGAYFAWRSFGAGASLLGWGFYALRAGRDQLYDLPPRLDGVPLRPHDQRGPRPARLRPDLRRRHPARLERGERPCPVRRSPLAAVAIGVLAGCAGGDEAASPVATTQVDLPGPTASNWRRSPSRSARP